MANPPNPQTAAVPMVKSNTPGRPGHRANPYPDEKAGAGGKAGFYPAKSGMGNDALLAEEKKRSAGSF